MKQITEATQRSARNAQTMLYTGTAAAKVMSGMSREYPDGSGPAPKEYGPHE